MQVSYPEPPHQRVRLRENKERRLADATLGPHAASGVRLRSGSRSSMIRSMNPLVFSSTHWLIAASVAGSLQSLDSARGPKASVTCPDKRVQKGTSSWVQVEAACGQPQPLLGFSQSSKDSTSRFRRLAIISYIRSIPNAAGAQETGSVTGILTEWVIRTNRGHLGADRLEG